MPDRDVFIVIIIANCNIYSCVTIFYSCNVYIYACILIDTVTSLWEKFLEKKITSIMVNGVRDTDATWNIRKDLYSSGVRLFFVSCGFSYNSILFICFLLIYCTGRHWYCWRIFFLLWSSIFSILFHLLVLRKEDDQFGIPGSLFSNWFTFLVRRKENKY